LLQSNPITLDILLSFSPCCFIPKEKAVHPHVIVRFQKEETTHSADDKTTIPASGYYYHPITQKVVTGEKSSHSNLDNICCPSTAQQVNHSTKYPLFPPITCTFTKRAQLPPDIPAVPHGAKREKG